MERSADESAERACKGEGAIKSQPTRAVTNLREWIPLVDPLRVLDQYPGNRLPPVRGHVVALSNGGGVSCESFRLPNPGFGTHLARARAGANGLIST